jgi:hypothetical protein
MNTNKILKYTEERNNRMEELLMESIVNLHKTVEEKQNQNKIWEDNLNENISLILNKPTINYKKDFETISKKIMTFSPHKLIDASTKEIMGILTKTDENQNATLTYLREMINYKNQEWFKLNNIEKLIVGSTKNTRDLEDTLINSFKNMEDNFSKINNGDTEYIIHQLEDLENKMNPNEMMEMIMKLSGDSTLISNQEKDTLELLKQDIKITEAFKSEMSEKLLNQNKYWKINHQQTSQMFDLSYSLTNELINQEKEQGEILTKLWENSMKDSKEIKNVITEISERIRTENELREKVHK